MSLLISDRYRTKAKPVRVDPEPAPLKVGPYLPARVLYERQKQRERMEREGVAYTTAPEVMYRRVDAPQLWGQRSVMPRDEREAKYDKPLVFMDRRPGRPALLAVGGGGEYWQALKERVDEERHYGTDAIVREPLPKNFYQDVWNIICEKRIRANKGLKSYGPATHGRRNREHFKIVSGPLTNGRHQW